MADSAEPADAANAQTATPTAGRAILARLTGALQPGGKTLPASGKAAPATADDPAVGDDEPADRTASAVDVTAVLIPASPLAALTPPAHPAHPVLPEAAAPSAAECAKQDPRGESDVPPATAPLPFPRLVPGGEAQAAGRSVPAAQPEPVPAEPASAAPVEARALVIDRAPAITPAAFTLAEGTAHMAGALHLRPVLPPARDSAAAGPVPDIAAPALVTAPVAGAMPTIAAPPSATPGPAPALDFAALVDRLIAARDAAQPGVGQGNVQVAVQHAEFGQVSLNFRHDPDGLSVAAASADPEFARAVQAATASAGAQNGTDVSSGQSRQPGGNPQAAPGQSHERSPDGRQSQPRGSDRAGDRAADNGSPDASRAGPGGPRRGVFA